ncbi:MAG: response regulator transcription factor [Chloroflexi bacterium]|nr:response regulator transcription factor [Chloroflexota bacterium]
MSKKTANGGNLHLLIVAESLLSRAGLSALLEERGCLVLGTVDGVDLEGDIYRLDPDLLVIDFGWETDAICGRLTAIDKEIPALALAAGDDESALIPVMRLLRSFTRYALLSRDCNPETLVAALLALDAGLTAIDPRLADLFASPLPHEAQPALNPLTARENDVLQLLARGLTNRAIGHELGITQHTVKFHVNAIMSKLDAQSRTEAVVRATQLGLILL